MLQVPWLHCTQVAIQKPSSKQASGHFYGSNLKGSTQAGAFLLQVPWLHLTQVAIQKRSSKQAPGQFYGSILKGSTQAGPFLLQVPWLHFTQVAIRERSSRQSLVGAILRLYFERFHTSWTFPASGALAAFHSSSNPGALK